MPRRITVECLDGHRKEITIGCNEKIPRCDAYSKSGTFLPCRRKREIVWDQVGPQGAPGFRVKGLSKNFG